MDFKGHPQTDFKPLDKLTNKQSRSAGDKAQRLVAERGGSATFSVSG